MAKISKWKKRVGVLLAVVLLAGVAAWVFREPLLQGAAKVWIVGDENLKKADAIVVLGGSIETRPSAAAELFERGLADRILVSKTELSPSVESGVMPAHHDLNIAVLHKEGVADSAISLFGEDLSSTWEEMCALRGWAKDEGKDSLIVITEAFPSRRVRWLFDRHCPDLDVQIHTVGNRRYDAGNWWKDEHGLITFQNEFIKYFYYQLKYRSTEAIRS